jgi:tripeptide aminopeptidase
MQNDSSWFQSKVLERFLRYVKIHTTSDSLSSSKPTTARQLDFAKHLVEELYTIGVDDVSYDENGFVIGRIEQNIEEDLVPHRIGLIAHLDTSEDAPGENVKPIVHERYDGNAIRLEEGVVIDPAEFPDLLAYKGSTIVTSDGTTLLGADDKAGIAAIMTAIEYLLIHEDIPRPAIEVIFTPDEETGTGKTMFPFDDVFSEACYTFDGGKEGVLEIECFEAYKASVELTGRSIHLGTAKGKLVNAVQMAKSFLSLLPDSETPETTDGREGYYCPLKVTGEIEKAAITIYIRDFEESECVRRIETLNRIAHAVEAEYPGGKASVRAEKQYHNMKKFLTQRPEVISILESAIRETGIEPVQEPIRGGTDGAYLSEKGIPTPNVFTGGANFHSRMEWVSLSAMVRAANVAVNLVRLWAEESNPKD